MIATSLETLMTLAKQNLDKARATGDLLWTDLAEASLNELIDRYVTLVTRNNQKGE